MRRSKSSIRASSGTMTTTITITLLLLIAMYPHSHNRVCGISLPSQSQVQSRATIGNTAQNLVQPPPVVVLSGHWDAAKRALRHPDCCVVSVAGLEDHLQVLHDQFGRNDRGLLDVDLRARIRVGSSSSFQHTYEDCWNVRNAVTPFDTYATTSSNSNHEDDVGDSITLENNNTTNIKYDDQKMTVDPCTLALQELARGVASLADGPFEATCQDVFLRVVCASSYKARDPMFHTDKAPLRGYVTLQGPGTDFMERPCTPWEYMTLRMFGTLPGSSSTTTSTANNLKRAGNLEFIVMKGDYYEYNNAHEGESPAGSAVALNGRWWQRTFACVHRSPPATTGGRRVIVSLDLADGDDDREWYEVGKRREWRSGMTQRKSRLVA